MIAYLNWRWLFYVPAVILAVGAVHWYLRGRNAPEVVGLPCLEEEGDHNAQRSASSHDYHLGFKHTLTTVLSSPHIWYMAFGLFFLNIVRYGFMDWTPTYMFEIQGATISMAAYKAMVIPIAGSMGALFAGWLSDKVCHLRRAPACAVMLLALAFCTWLFPQIPGTNWVASLIVLALIGFLTYGPHVAIVTYVPMDFGTRKVAASTIGFIDGMGYVGAAVTGIASGFLVDHFGWNAAYYLWMGGALASAALMFLLWNYRPVVTKYH